MITARNPENGYILPGGSNGRRTATGEMAPADLAKRARKLTLVKLQDQYSQMHEIAEVAIRRLGAAVYNGNLEAAAIMLKATQPKPELQKLQVIMPDADCSTFDGLLQTGAAVVEGLVKGEVSVGQAKHVVEVLKGFAQLRMVDELEKLRAVLKEVEELTAEKLGDTSRQALPADQLPTWGKLGGDKSPAIDDDVDDEELRRSLME